MKTFHPAVKILTATMFLLLMFGFVAFRSGAFDGTRSARLKLNVSRTGVSHTHKSKNDSEITRRAKPKENYTASSIQPLSISDMAASSKVIISTPVDWSKYGTDFAMMAGSKSAGIISTPVSSAYGGIFTTPYWWKAQSKGAQLKQGKK